MVTIAIQKITLKAPECIKHEREVEPHAQKNWTILQF